MTDIDIDVPEELRVRLARAAERSGQDEHEFMLAAIVEKVERSERLGGSEGEADIAQTVEELRCFRRSNPGEAFDISELVRERRR